MDFHYSYLPYIAGAISPFLGFIIGNRVLNIKKKKIDIDNEKHKREIELQEKSIYLNFIVDLKRAEKDKGNFQSLMNEASKAKTA